jgi:radical SAM-linked protein
MPSECRFLLRFRLTDDLRFLSHLDLMRLFERACRRAGLPLKFSQGFNPRPAVSLPVPHAVGIAGEDEPLLIELTGPCTSERLTELLNAQLPPAGAVLSARTLQPGEKLRPEKADYRVELPTDCPPPAAEAAAGLPARDSISAVRRRRDGRPEKTLDIRRFVLEARAEGPTVRMSLAVTDSGSARPSEVLQALGVGEDGIRRARIVRTAVHLRSERRPRTGGAAPAEAAERSVKPTECNQPEDSTDNNPGDGSGGARAEEAAVDGRTSGSPALPDC